MGIDGTFGQLLTDRDLTVEVLGERHDAAVYPVACGCSQGGACANLVEVDGEYIPLKGDLDLGAMEFCGQDGLHAVLTGAVEDGAFVATAYELRK